MKRMSAERRSVRRGAAIRAVIFPLILMLFLSSAARTQAASDPPLEITDAKTCSSFDAERNPIGVTSEFPAGTGTIHCWFAWKNMRNNPLITARWRYVDEEIPVLDFPITLTRRSGTGITILQMPKNRALPSGSYQLNLESQGKILKTISFKVRLTSSSPPARKSPSSP